jgi:hypothetical protein
VQIRAQTMQIPHLDIFYSRRIIFIDAGHRRGRNILQLKIQHENNYIFLKILTQKGVENL